MLFCRESVLLTHISSAVVGGLVQKWTPKPVEATSRVSAAGGGKKGRAGIAVVFLHFRIVYILYCTVSKIIVVRLCCIILQRVVGAKRSKVVMITPSYKLILSLGLN